MSKHWDKKKHPPVEPDGLPAIVHDPIDPLDPCTSDPKFVGPSPDDWLSEVFRIIPSLFGTDHMRQCSYYSISRLNCDCGLRALRDAYQGYIDAKRRVR